MKACGHCEKIDHGKCSCHEPGFHLVQIHRNIHKYQQNREQHRPVHVVTQTAFKFYTFFHFCRLNLSTKILLIIPCYMVIGKDKLSNLGYQLQPALFRRIRHLDLIPGLIPYNPDQFLI